MEPIKDIEVELRSEPMNQLLAQPPSWIVRSGNGLFLLLIILVIGLSWLIEYPDEIGGEVNVTMKEPPIEYSNQLYVQLRNLPVHDGQQIRKNQVLAQFDSEADPHSIQLAENYLLRLTSQDYSRHQPISGLSNSLHLGAFQESWTHLQMQINAWNLMVTSGISDEQIATIQREIRYRKQLKSIAERKIHLSETEYAIIAEELASSERLSEQNIVSKQSINLEKRTKAQAMQTVESYREEHIQNLIQINNLEEQLVQLKLEKQQQEQQLISAIRIAVAKLRNELNSWRKNEVWTAPCSGKVLFNKKLQRNKFYGAKEASLVIVPNGHKYVALATIKTSGAGKVKVGHKALIELEDYPKYEYGLLEGQVKTITQIDREGKYEVEIQLSHQLKTTYGKSIPAKARLVGKVKIITRKKRLLERLFEQLTNSF